MSNKDSVVIECTAYWPFLVKASDLSDKYQMDLGNISKEGVKKLMSLGIDPKQDEPDEGSEWDKETFITCYSQSPMTRFKWPNKESLTDEQLAALGNGTKLRVKLSAYEWSFKKKKGVSPSFQAAVVLDYKEYAGGGFDDDMFDEDDDLDDENPFE